MDYQVTVPSDTGGIDELRAWHRNSKESVWTKPSSTPIDLHTAVSDTPLLIPDINVRSPSQSVDVGAGITLPALATDELFAYLAVHGAWSNWYRLKWITDVAGLLRGRGGDEIDRIYSRSQELGAGRAAGQTLMLADALFDTLRHNQKLRARLRSDRVQSRLLRHALRSVTRDAGEPTEQRFGTVPIHLAHLMLLPGTTAKLTELSRKARWLAFRLKR
jgi:hypothetical protein